MRDAAETGFTTFETLSQGRPVVVLAPHPDDESLGCGALLAQAFAAGTGARIVCLTDGSASHRGSRLFPPRRLALLRRRELEDAVARLGGRRRDILWLGQTDAQTERSVTRAAVVRLLARLCTRLGARSLFATLPTDPHCDHRSAAAIAAAVAGQTGVTLYSYPIWSRWQAPDFRERLGDWHEHRLDPGPHTARKRAAIAAHESQHGAVIDDATEAFCLDPGFVEEFASGPELYYERRS